jgi:hypothetical protein
MLISFSGGHARNLCAAHAAVGLLRNQSTAKLGGP